MKSLIAIVGLTFVVVIGSSLLISGCGGSKSTLGDIGSPSSGSAVPTATPTPAPSPTPSGATNSSIYPFEVIVQSQYDTGGSFTTEADCQIPVGTLPLPGNAAAASSCNLSIPEGRLHFSGLSFVMNIGASATASGCAIVVFRPYYYQASTSAAFVADWGGGASTDCSGAAPLPALCFGGVGRLLIPSFPTFGGIYYTIGTSNTFTASVVSANSQTIPSSRWAVNTLAATGASFTFTKDAGDGYVANTLQNYKFTCNDIYMQPVYSFTMNIDKLDIVGSPNVPGDPTINQFPDWDPASWDR